jgi:hypothetical protein
MNQVTGHRHVFDGSLIYRKHLRSRGKFSGKELPALAGGHRPLSGKALTDVVRLKMTRLLSLCESL